MGLFLCLSTQSAFAETTKDQEKQKGKKELYLVEFNKTNQKANQQNFTNTHATVEKQFKYLNLTTVYLTEQQAKALKKNPTIKRIIKDVPINAEPDTVLPPDGIEHMTINDVYEDNPTWAYDATNVDESLTGQSIKVGVFDMYPVMQSNEYRLNFEESATCNNNNCDKLDPLELAEEDKDKDLEHEAPTSGHGTEVASVIGSIRHTETKVSGISPSVTLYSLTPCKSGSHCDLNAYATVLEYAIEHKFDVLNMSFHVDPIDSDTLDFLNSKLTETYEQGVYLVASAGNEPIHDGKDFTVRKFPGAHPLVTTVSAVYQSKLNGEFYFPDFYDKDGNYIGWARGEEVDITAPGVNVATTSFKTNDKNEIIPVHRLVDGTSLSSPIVSGLVALIKEKFPNYTNDDIYAMLMLNTKELPLYGELWNKKTGYGLAQGTFTNTLNKRNSTVHLNEDKTVYSVPKLGKTLNDISNPKWTIADKGDYKSQTSYDSEEGRFYQINSGEPRLQWVTYGHPLMKDVNSRSLYNDISYLNDLFDGDLSNYAMLWRDNSVMQRLEQPVTVNATDIQFLSGNAIYPLTVTLYDKDKQVLKTLKLGENGVSPIEKTEHVQYISVENKDNPSTVWVNDLQLLGEYENEQHPKKETPLTTNLSFVSQIDERSLFEEPTDLKPREEQHTIAVKGVKGKKFNVNKVYDWDDSKHQYRWMQVSSATLNIENKWVRLDDSEMGAIYKGDLTDIVSGQVVKQFDTSYHNDLFDNNSDTHTVINGNGYVDYEFDYPVSISSYYMEQYLSMKNKGFELTFYSEDGTSQLVNVGDNELFERYNQLNETIQNVKKIRIKSLYEYPVWVPEIAFYGSYDLPTPLPTVKFVADVTIPRGKIKVYDTPVNPYEYEVIDIEENYSTVSEEGYGIMAVDGKYKWLKVVFPDGESKWINTVESWMVSPTFEKGLTDHVYGQVVDTQFIDSTAELTNNYFGSARMDMKGYMEYRFDQPVSVNQFFLKLRFEVDNSDAADNLKLTLLDKNRQATYTRILSRDDLKKQLFDLPQTFTDVYGYKIENLSDKLIYIAEIELKGTYTKEANDATDIEQSVKLGSAYSQKIYGEIGGIPTSTVDLSNQAITIHKGYGWNAEQSRYDWYLISSPINNLNHVWTKLDNLYEASVYLWGIFDKVGANSTKAENAYWEGDFTNNYPSGYGSLYATGSVTYILYHPTDIQKAYVKLYDRAFAPSNLVYEFYDKDGALLGSHAITQDDLYKGFFALNQTYQDVASVKLVNKGIADVRITEIELF